MTMSPLRVVNPFNQQQICELLFEEQAAIEAKLAAAQQAFTQWRKLSLAERSEHVRHGLARFRENAEQTAQEVSLQMGKPIVQSRRECDTLMERAEQSLADAPGALAADVLPAKRASFAALSTNRWELC